MLFVLGRHRLPKAMAVGCEEGREWIAKRSEHHFIDVYCNLARLSALGASKASRSVLNMFGIHLLGLVA